MYPNLFDQTNQKTSRDNVKSNLTPRGFGVGNKDNYMNDSQIKKNQGNKREANSEEANRIIEKIRDILSERGVRGLTSLSRTFRVKIYIY